MLESNTEAQQATGTGSKLGPGSGQGAGGGREGERGVKLPSGFTTTALGSCPHHGRRDLLWNLCLQPRELGTRVLPGIPRMARREQEPRPQQPSLSSPPLTPLNTKWTPT